MDRDIDEAHSNNSNSSQAASATHTSPQLMPPMLMFSDFHIAGLIACEDCASVYRALYVPTAASTIGSLESLTARAVVLKVLNGTDVALLHDNTVKQELQRRYSLRLPSVARCHGLTIVPDGRLAIVMDVAGGSLADMLAREAYYLDMPMQGRVWLAQQVSHAVYSLAQRDIVHSDIKPSSFYWVVAGREDSGTTAVVKISDVGDLSLQTTVCSMSQHATNSREGTSLHKLGIYCSDNASACVSFSCFN